MKDLLCRFEPLVRRHLIHRNRIPAQNPICAAYNCNQLYTNSKRKHSTADYKSTFLYDELIVKQLPDDQRNWSVINSKEPPKFGQVMSDHMLSVEWSSSRGWSAPEIRPLAALQLHPAAKVLHYAQTIFEGMKAFRSPITGKINLFRPEMNMQRLQRSAERSCLPNFDAQELLKCIKHLIRTDQLFVPKRRMESLYVRPTLIGHESSLGVSAANSALLYVLLSPVGSYFASSQTQECLKMPEERITADECLTSGYALYADTERVRAHPGGTGNHKMGCNYAPTIQAQANAAALGCDQVLWLYGARKQLTEVGTMNIFLYIVNDNGQKELITPPLSDQLILPGVTRDSVLTLAKKIAQKEQFVVSERNITMNDFTGFLAGNRIIEMFGAGTACAVSPIKSVLYQNEWLHLPKLQLNEKISSKLFEQLVNIQYGIDEYPGWNVPIDE